MFDFLNATENAQGKQQGAQMWKATVSIVLLIVVSSTALAGDRLEGFFWIIGSEKAKPGGAYSIKELLTEVDKVAARWKASCGTEVDVWHSDFMENMEPGHWVVFTVLEEEKNRALAMVGSDTCSQGGYLKEGSMVITGFQQWCMSEPDSCQ